MNLGKITGYTTQGQSVRVAYEKREVIIEVLTEKIVRIFDPVMMEDYASVAIEGNKELDTKYSVSLGNGQLQLCTGTVKLTLRENLTLEISDEAGRVLLSSFDGERTIKSRLTEKDKKALEAEGHKFQTGDERNYKVQAVFDMQESDCFYGMGDKTGYLNKRGYAFENWNSDIPDIHHENMPALYKSIPFVLVKKEKSSFGLFFDNTFHSYMNFGKEKQEYFYYGADGGNLDIYFMAGPAMTDVIEQYTYLTGRAPLPQLWTLGYHQCRWGYECADDIVEVANGFRENDIPCESVQYDIDYMDGYRVFTWNEKDYGPAGEIFSKLKKDGFKPVVIIDPGTKKDEKYFMYRQGIENGYFAKDKEGSVYENAVWPGLSTYPDFGRTDVRKWWSDSHKILTDMGVMGVWNDMNEPASFNGPLPLDVQFSVNDRPTNHEEAHNTYGHFMSRATFEGLKEYTGKRPMVITRACYAGTQKYSTVWTGDNQSVWSHLRMLIPQLCNLGMSGFSIAGTDIGGFGGDTTPELLSRWVEAACFSTFFRNHSAKGTLHQEPWQFGEKTMEIYRKYVKLHYQFLPYIYDLLYKSQNTGLPVMRPLVLHYENDENTYNLNDEFLVGEDLLVAPVVEQGATKRMVYLPAGVWIDYNSCNRIEGGRWIIADAPIDVLPMYIKEGAIIPTYQVVSYVGEKTYNTLTLINTGKAASYTHYQDNGEDYEFMDGKYNLYQFMIDSNGNLSTKMLHEGYTRYESVELVNL